MAVLFSRIREFHTSARPWRHVVSKNCLTCPNWSTGRELECSGIKERFFFFFFSKLLQNRRRKKGVFWGLPYIRVGQRPHLALRRSWKKANHFKSSQSELYGSSWLGAKSIEGPPLVVYCKITDLLTGDLHCMVTIEELAHCGSSRHNLTLLYVLLFA
jgi:hypothetical protein